ncbi:MAG TPA: bifunctional (p)ppGpp synthetase/guanosine-3',5'-bis(diphosphate) 3'-pyrophosphohydrolase [Bellilinea sp.]|nr:bifunctional (p)ppGpp synthetase/guanosine-3',5'-bis(diphosphate) 3'-pyrophosphohydrolase [Bellilinea sp.]
MTIESFINSLSSSYSVVDRENIRRAYEYSEKAHDGQKRASGEPYINHCLAVATILSELVTSPVMIIAALLHDTVEDTSASSEDIRQNFGDEVAKLVEGVTKLINLPRVSKSEKYLGDEFDIYEDDSDEPAAKTRKRDIANETLRKVFLAMDEDVRVVLIKLADRLHNMRTLGYIPENKRKRIAKETLEIFAPLANRLGIWQIKWELEDLSFRHLEPDKYQEIAEKLAEKRIDREQLIVEVMDKIRNVLDQNNIKAEISGRPKHIYSIFKKMNEKGKAFEMVRDLRAFRCIVKDIPTCYAALGVIHTTWRPLPQEFDDYIAAPKENYYQSLHTAVIYDDGKPIEVQIRTPEMHQSAEFGIASHWRYKERELKDTEYENRINWLRSNMEWRSDVDDPQEFVDSMKSDVFQDRVYIFTPRGDIIDMPAGSTPIDFAYHVHTEVGNRCRGAKVNGKLVTLDYQLKTGDQVEILAAKQGGPSRDWLNSNLKLVNTQRARSKIRAWFKKQDRGQNLEHGKNMLDRELKRLGLSEMNNEMLAKLLEFKDMDELYVAIGCGDVSLGRIVNRLSEISSPKTEALFPLTPKSSKVSSDGIDVVGLSGLLTNMAKCCSPAPGDEIVGYITRGRGATIHRQDCPNILRINDKERLIKVTWGTIPKVFPVTIIVRAYDRQGLMNDISNIITNENVNLADFQMNSANHIANVRMVLQVNDLTQLSRILTRIENVPNVQEAHRLGTKIATSNTKK